MRDQSARKTGVIVQSISELMQTRNRPLLLSRAGAVATPGLFIFPDGRAYIDLFSGPVLKRSPAQVNRMGLLNRLIGRSSLSKILIDAQAGFDISIVSYPMKVNLAAWGVVTDAIGRSFSALVTEDGTLELSYQGGLCHTKNDWATHVKKDLSHEARRIGHFYRKALQLAGNRIVVAGTLGFGFWDALWMSFDLNQAYDMLFNDRKFVQTVFDHWKCFHIESLRVLMDAGIRTVFHCENSCGFPQGRNITAQLDPLLGEHLRELTSYVRLRGGCTFLSCNADEMLETDYPAQWGFDGIGPMQFRDQEDLIAAAQGLSEDLILAGSINVPNTLRSFVISGGFSANLIRSVLHHALANSIAGCAGPVAASGTA